MLIKPFGGAFTFPYYPHVGGTPINPPNQTPTIYVFDSKPSDAAARDGTGSIATISAWTEATSNYRPFTVAAIGDPGDETKTKAYYVAINYVAVASGSATVDVQTFTLSRPDGQTADPTPTNTEIKAEDKNIGTYFTDGQIDNTIIAAEAKVKDALRDKDLNWTQVENPEDLKRVIIYRALAELWLQEVTDEGDAEKIKFTFWMDTYKAAINSLKFQYDANNDDDISATEAATRTNTTELVR